MNTRDVVISVYARMFEGDDSVLRGRETRIPADQADLSFDVSEEDGAKNEDGVTLTEALGDALYEANADASWSIDRVDDVLLVELELSHSCANERELDECVSLVHDAAVAWANGSA